jgi:hypothetical protein
MMASIRLVSASAMVLAGALAATAAADVTGTVTVLGNAGRPPLRGKAFLDRTENPFTGGRMVDPMPQIAVVLTPTGETAAPPASTAPQEHWHLLGESFDRPLIVVAAGTEVVIHNDGRRAPSLYIEGDQDRLPPTPLNSGGERAFKAETAGAALTIRDQDTAHLTGTVLVVDTPYFRVPGKDGKFTISGMPDGSYVARVWYRTGWIADPGELADGEEPKPLEKEVSVRDGKAKLEIQLPAGLAIAGAAAGK